MSQVEIELEEDTKSVNELEDELSSRNFLDIVDPDCISDELGRINDEKDGYKGKIRVNLLPLFVGMYGTVTGPINLAFDPGILSGSYMAGSLATFGTFHKIHENLEESLEDLEDEEDDLKQMAENWYKLPGTVNLSYLVDQGLESQFEEPYRKWLSDNIGDWSVQSKAADLANQELDELDVEGVKVNASAFDYGVQRVYLEELDEDHYRFVLQTYDKVEDEILNQYWGITDEKGRRIVEENDGVKNFGVLEDE